VPVLLIDCQRGVAEVPGVEATKVDFEQKTAKVRFDPAKTNALVKPTTNAGFLSVLRK